MNIEEKVRKTIEKHSMLSRGDRVVIGLSGGADSVALLCVLCSLRELYHIEVHAAHINHMIRGSEAYRDADYAKKLAEGFNAEFHLLECDVPQLAEAKGISEEMAGREVRYDFFEKIAQGGKIAVAHHMGDSAETTLLNLIRGSSLKGLKGISPVKGNVIRPLTDCKRSEIEDYLKSKNIDYMTDSTNMEDIYSRNLVRNRLIPAMEKINPNVISTIYDNSRLLADDEDFLTELCNKYAEACIIAEEGRVVLNLEKIEAPHIAVKRRLLMLAAELLKGSRTGISFVNIDSVLSLSTGGKTFFCGIYAQRSYNEIIFSLTPTEYTEFSYELNIPSKAVIPQIGKAYNFLIEERDNITSYEKNVIYLDYHKLQPLTLRSRRDGDAFSPLGLKGRKKVKDFLIDAKIPRFMRSTLPILESGGKIAAILCLRADEAYKVTDETKKILMISEERL